MKIEHTALYVSDLEASKSFFETYFEATAGQKYHNPKTGFTSYFLSFSDCARLEIMQDEVHSNTDNPSHRCGFAHIAFSLGSRENVDSLTKRLHDDGYTVTSNPRTTGDGYYESCILDGEGNKIELTL